MSDRDGEAHGFPSEQKRSAAVREADARGPASDATPASVFQQYLTGCADPEE